LRFRVTTPVERHRAMSWAQRLKRVFKLDLTSCENCGGQVRVLASIEPRGPPEGALDPG
jgi:hypothetical protein